MLPTPAMKRVIFETLPDYDPYPLQWQAHSETEARLIQVVGGERGGKSRWTAAELTAAMILPNNQVAVAGNDYDSCKKECRYVLDDLRALGALAYESTPKQGSWEIKSHTGSRLETVSLKDGAGELTATGEFYNLVAVVEAGRVEEDCLRAARGRVSETRGRVLLSGTMWDDFGWYAELSETLEGPNLWDGVLYRLPSWANTTVFPKGQADPEIRAWRDTLTEAEAARRIDAKKVPSPARLYPEFDGDTHVRWIYYDPEAPVELTVDPGYFPSRYAVLAIQVGWDQYGREELWVVDEIWRQKQVHLEIIDEARRRAWWPLVHSVYGGHESTQHAATKSCAEVWRRETDLPFVVLPRYAVQEKVMRVKTMLIDPRTETPRLLVDPRCKGTMYEFRHWKRKTDRDGKVISDKPIDKDCDAMDALGNYVMHTLGPVDRPASQTRKGGYIGARG